MEFEEKKWSWTELSGTDFKVVPGHVLGLPSIVSSDESVDQGSEESRLRFEIFDKEIN